MNRIIGTASLYLGDCLEVLRGMAENSVDSIVTDPPYGLNFMGKKWDYDVPSTEIWAECLRVLKPGGHLLAFAGTRTQHRMAVRIEDAGFEIRDMIAWVYGCLDDATEVATEKGVMPHHKTKIGDRVLCYDVEHGEYSYQPILEIVEYDYSDTAYRLVGDFGEQVVSRNHRVIVERGGSEAFQLAEALECEARVPVLESLSALRKAVHGAYQGAGCAQQDVQSDLCKCADRSREHWSDATGSAQGRDDQVRGLRGECVEASSMAAQGGDADVQQGVQRGATRCGVGCARAQGTGKLDSRIGSRLEGANDRGVEPGVEGWSDVSEQERCVCRSADQVRSMPSADVADGSVGRIRDGASVTGGVGDQSRADTGGVRSPHQPRCDGQPRGEPDAVCHERSTQGVRAWEGHRSAVVRVVPFHYTGKVWCLRVPTGAFVAVRNGVAFPTGNSGFPKSLDVSKAIDKAAGLEREVIGVADRKASLGSGGRYGESNFSEAPTITAPATEAARQWQGWGTALKPALEPITMARKPFASTVAANVLAHGTGALNIDGCRVEGTPAPTRFDPAKHGHEGWRMNATGAECAANASPLGRWPANLIHDGSADVVSMFPQSAGQQGDVRGTEPSSVTNGIYGDFAGRFASPARNDTGSAARFFYCAKASRADRNDGVEHLNKKPLNWSSGTQNPGSFQSEGTDKSSQNNHPTVKPTDLMAYLCRLVTPAGGIVLDPFMGSGSTGRAAGIEQFKFIGIEINPEYFEIACLRIDSATAQQGLEFA